MQSECHANIVGASLEIRVFADAVSLGVPFRGYRFAQPPVIESLRSPVLRTLYSRIVMQNAVGGVALNVVGISVSGFIGSVVY